jgi:putative transposase
MPSAAPSTRAWRWRHCGRRSRHANLRPVVCIIPTAAQYAAEAYRKLLAAYGLIGSMSRRGNPYDNAEAESFMKTLKVEAVYPMEFESFEDAATYLPNFIEAVYNRRRLRSSLGYLGPVQFEDQHLRATVKVAA